MGNAIDAVFQAVRKGFEDNQATQKRRMLLAEIVCVEGNERPDGTLSNGDLDFCRRMKAIGIVDGWVHSAVITNDTHPVTEGYSYYTFNADIGRYYKKCVEVRKDFGAPIYAVGFCGKKMYSSMDDDKFHGQPGDEAELPLLRHAIKTTFGVELPAVIDKSYGYYLWGTDYKVWSSTESVDVATLQCVVPK